MKILDAGHSYELDVLDGNLNQTIKFVKRGRGVHNHPGTINQDVLRVLIDRVKFLNNEIPWDGNDKIIYHLRMALALQEARAMFRRIEKEEFKPEFVPTSALDGHFMFADKEGGQ
jgi:hypothetical protein